MIYTLTGDNTFAIHQAQQQLIDAFRNKHGANGVERVDAEDLTPQRLPDLLQGGTLFAPSRLVVLTNLASNKPMLEPLTKGLERLAADTTVVITDSMLDKRTKLYKFLAAQSTFKTFDTLSSAQLATWAQAEAVRLGGSLGSSDAKYLVDRLGSDQWRLQNELEKLVAYQPAIDRSAINELTEPTPEGTAFDLLDAALSGQPDKVQTLVASIRTTEDPYKLCGLLAAQVHALAVVATAGTRPADSIAKDAGVHPFVVRKTQAKAKQLGVKGAAKVAAAVATCDYQLKHTSASPWVVLQLCLQRVAHVAI